jgi:hypothetical protein
MPARDRPLEIDTSLVDEMLALNPAQRIARHDEALDLVLALESAGKRLHGLEPRAAASPRPPRV